jgi:hypothetical protein
MLFALNRQVETWVTRKLVYNFKGNFRCQLLDVTQLNRNELAELYLKAATYGIPSVIHLCAILGINQVDMMALNYLQNNMLDIANQFIPLSSSNTQSAMGDEGGRPTTDSPSESTVRNRENGTDQESAASKV